MTGRGQLEASIADRLARLSDADMQRVAEDYGRIRFPKRYPHFDFRAFSEEGKSRPGWPDAWVNVDGQIDGIEATGAKDKSAVLAHLQEDLDKAKGRNPKLSGLLIVSGHPAVQLKPEELASWLRRFVSETGLASDRVHLVFGGGLVADLAQPEFARTRIEVLGLNYAPSHFKLVRAKRGPDEGRLDSTFIPSESDYEAGNVHRPDAADQVLAQLDRHRCALVRGVGASGKSVLAWLLALAVAEQRRPAYILDLAGYVDVSPDPANALVEDLYRFGHPEALFILDNCHLAESLAKEVVLGWQDLVPSHQPQLLLLARELHNSRGSLIDGLRIEPLTLRARQPEVRGVYMRLARRQLGILPPPEPPPEVLDAWVSIFGGNPKSADTTTDLIAFSAAALARMDDLLNQSWTLSETDAVHEIQSVYLDPTKLSEAETRNLMQLCVMQELDLSLTEDALANQRAGLDRCSKRLGLVFRRTLGTTVRFVLAHAALGRLILGAAHVSLDRVAELLDIALRRSNIGAIIVSRLVALGRLEDAKVVATEMVSRPDRLLTSSDLKCASLVLRSCESAGVTLPATLATFLTSKTGRESLAMNALHGPLDDLASFLGYIARTAALNPVLSTFAADLALPANRQSLTKKAIETPLQFLASFLNVVARTSELKQVLAALAEDFSVPANLQSLADSALKSPLPSLSSFLNIIGRTAELKPVFVALAGDLAQPDNRERLTRTLETEALDKVVSILRPGPASGLWDAAFEDVDAGRWSDARHKEQSPQLSSFVNFQRIAAERNRSELAEVPALRLLVDSTQKEWHQPGIGLHHLSHVLRLAPNASTIEIDDFLDRVASPDWLDGQFELGPSGGLAGGLLSLASTLEPDQWRRFHRKALIRRIAWEFSVRRRPDAQTLANALSLLGASTAIGMSGPVQEAFWPDANTLALVLATRAPDPDRASVGPIDVQLWLGLREMARWRTKPISVPSKLGRRILERWQATKLGRGERELPPRVLALNAGMVNWLRRCQVEDWRLVPPEDESARGTNR